MLTLTPNLLISSLKMSEKDSPPYFVIAYAALNKTGKRPLMLVTFTTRPIFFFQKKVQDCVTSFSDGGVSMALIDANERHLMLKFH